MKCRDCGANTGCHDSRLILDGARRWRRRRCLGCKTAFTTYEISEYDLAEMEQAVARMRDLDKVLEVPFKQARAIRRDPR